MQQWVVLVAVDIFSFMIPRVLLAACAVSRCGGSSAKMDADTTERPSNSKNGGGGWFGGDKYALIEQLRTDKSELEKLRIERAKWTTEKAKLEKDLLKLGRLEVRGRKRLWSSAAVLPSSISTAHQLSMSHMRSTSSRRRISS